MALVVIAVVLLAGLLLAGVDPVVRMTASAIYQARVWYYAGSTHYCPVCQSHLSMFVSGGTKTRSNVECVACGSRERHRRDWLYVEKHTDLLDGRPKKMLHVAPEASLAKRFQAAPNIDYLSGDLDPALAMVKMDITDIQFPDNTFDVIYCSHVMEHIPDDRLAMRELYRVLKPGAWAIIHAPITQKQTFEDPSVTTPEERFRVFGQSDHVRIYGEDYVDRLRESGFEVAVEHFIESFSQEEVERLGLQSDQYPADRYIYVSRKPSESGSVSDSVRGDKTRAALDRARL